MLTDADLRSKIPSHYLSCECETCEEWRKVSRAIADYAYARGAWDVVDTLGTNFDEKYGGVMAQWLTSRGIERPK